MEKYTILQCTHSLTKQQQQNTKIDAFYFYFAKLKERKQSSALSHFLY